MRCGIVLAAGKASRMPFKVLLPLRSGPVVSSAINFCRINQCEKVIVVASENIALHIYLAAQSIHMRIQAEPIGVVDAIRTGCIGVNADEFLVTFGDNVYDENEEVLAYGASIREYSGPNANQLDGWDGSKWVNRGLSPQMKFAGWLFATIKTIRTIAREPSLIDAFNVARVDPIPCTGKWLDVGTPETYEHYWRTE